MTMVLGTSDSVKVFVYRNLHRKCWSVKNRSTGRVARHLDCVMVSNCEFRVSEAGRQRVLREKRKNVHAGVIGDYDNRMQSFPDSLDSWIRVRYDPYKHDSFVSENGKQIRFASQAILTSDGKVYAR